MKLWFLLQLFTCADPPSPWRAEMYMQGKGVPGKCGGVRAGRAGVPGLVAKMGWASRDARRERRCPSSGLCGRRRGRQLGRHDRCAVQRRRCAVAHVSVVYLQSRCHLDRPSSLHQASATYPSTHSCQAPAASYHCTQALCPGQRVQPFCHLHF